MDGLIMCTQYAYESTHDAVEETTEYVEEDEE